MTAPGFNTTPEQTTYDIVIIGGGIMGASTAFFLSEMFKGSVLVIERDPTYAFASTTHTNSCMRQQFSTELNIRVSQFAADYIRDLPASLRAPDAPQIGVQSFGYMYLADSPEFAEQLKANARVQRAAGTETEILSAEEIAQRYPFYAVDDLILGSINLKDEGYFDGAALFDWWRKLSRQRGVEYLVGEVAGLNVAGDRVAEVILADGSRIGCGQVVNSAGPRAAKVAAMAGLSLPVEPRKRYTWIFKAEQPLMQDLPLTIDPSGVHFRENGGGTYMAGGHTIPDPGVAPDDFAMDFGIWENKIWPAIATRVPQFEAIKVTNEWVGHYAYNTLDQNAALGPHPDVANFYFLNGFSGHGLQQSPAMGRGIAELLTHGSYQSLDLSPFRYERVLTASPMREHAVI